MPPCSCTWHRTFSCLSISDDSWGLVWTKGCNPMSPSMQSITTAVSFCITQTRHPLKFSLASSLTPSLFCWRRLCLLPLILFYRQCKSLKLHAEPHTSPSAIISPNLPWSYSTTNTFHLSFRVGQSYLPLIPSPFTFDFHNGAWVSSLIFNTHYEPCD